MSDYFDSDNSGLLSELGGMAGGGHHDCHDHNCHDHDCHDHNHNHSHGHEHGDSFGSGLGTVISLADDEGNSIDFVFLDLIIYCGEEYAVLQPDRAAEWRTVDDDSDGDIVILKVEVGEDGMSEYSSVDDEDTLLTVFDIFRKRYTSLFDE